MEPPGTLIGRGRAADVYDIGGGRVLRRYRTPHPGFVEREAEMMMLLRSRGAPVPEVYDASGDDLVMERVAGRSMLDVLASRPWQARRLGRRLGLLHSTLHAIEVPDDVSLRHLDGPAGAGNRVLHLDFHPDNVLIDGQDVMVIDWTNAAMGAAGLDVATTWMLMVIGSVDDIPVLVRPIARQVRRALVKGYLHERDPSGEIAAPWVALACERRLADPATRPEEIVRVRQFAATHGGVDPR